MYFGLVYVVSDLYKYLNRIDLILEVRYLQWALALDAGRLPKSSAQPWIAHKAKPVENHTKSYSNGKLENSNASSGHEGGNAWYKLEVMKLSTFPFEVQVNFIKSLVLESPQTSQNTLQRQTFNFVVLTVRLQPYLLWRPT